MSRTPVLVIIARFYFVIFTAWCLFGTLLNWAGGRTMIDWGTCFVVSAVLTFMYVGWGWLFTTAGMELMNWNNPVYKLAKQQTGFRPYWDCLPPIFNPSTNGFDGPPVKYGVCPRCDNVLDVDPAKPVICPHCNYGGDGDYSAYFAKYGYVRPAGMSDADWNRILVQDRQRNNCSGGTCNPNPEPPEDWQPMGGNRG
jgi:hypothetical protein